MSSKSFAQINWIDIFKVIASQVIVFHHFFIYGPISRGLAKAFPGLSDFLVGYGSYAVQVFLVIGGFLAIEAIPKLLNKLGVWRVILNRYLRLIPPYVVALFLTMLFAYFTRHWMNEEYVGLSETLPQIAAHVFLLHGLLGYESISAGVWYVAIDWQLYTFIALIVYLFRFSLSSVIVLFLLTLVSLLTLNRLSPLENYFIYFLGAYGVGVFASLANNKSSSTFPIYRYLFFTICLITLTAMYFQVWLRNYVVIGTGLALYFGADQSIISMNRGIASVISWLSQRSYALFLIHFAGLLFVNTVVVAEEIDMQSFAWLGLMFGWLFSMLASHMIYQLIEIPLKKFQFRLA